MRSTNAAAAFGACLALYACASPVRTFDEEEGEGGEGGACEAGLVDCSGVCVDVGDDPQHCGDCDVACSQGEICASGQCVLSCQAGLIDCDGVCTDPSSSNSHCGATGDCLGPNAGEACAAGHVCVDGACALSCPAGLIDCAGTCVDPGTSPEFCGASGDCAGPNAGVACTSTEACVDGQCVPLVPLNFLISERGMNRQHVWEPATNALTLFHQTTANDIDCNADEGSALVWFVEHFNDQMGTYIHGSGTGVNAQWMVPYAYPKHVTVLNGSVIVMSRNDATLKRYDFNGNEIASVPTGGTVGQGMATDGTDLFVSLWDGAVSSFRRYDANLTLLATIANPAGLVEPNLVDIAYDPQSGHFFGLAATFEQGTLTETNKIVEFVMGGAVVQEYTLGILMDGIGQNGCI